MFVGINLILAAYFLDSVPSPNPTSRVLPVLTLFEEGTYAIDKYEKLTMDKSFINGHYYSDKAPLSTWLVIPVYGALRPWHPGLAGTGQSARLPIVRLGDFICGTVPFVVWLWLVLRRIVAVAPATNPVLLCMLPLYGSFVFAYSGVFMSHVLAGALLCGSHILLKNHHHPTLCGLLLGLAVLAEFPTALALPIWAVAVWQAGRRNMTLFLLGGLPCVLALLSYNKVITGSFTAMPYNFVAESAFSDMRSFYGLRLPQAEALWGLLFSRFRGLFFYAPALAVIAMTYVLERRTAILRNDLVTPLGLLAVCYISLIASYFVWWGGWAYGPRHLIPLAMVLFYAGLPMMARTNRFRRTLYVVSAGGIAMVWVSKATALYLMPEQFLNPVFDLALPSFLRGQLRSDAVLTQFFQVDRQVAAWVWVGLFAAGSAGLRATYRELVVDRPNRG